MSNDLDLSDIREELQRASVTDPTPIADSDLEIRTASELEEHPEDSESSFEPQLEVNSLPMQKDNYQVPPVPSAPYGDHRHGRNSDHLLTRLQAFSGSPEKLKAHPQSLDVFLTHFKGGIRRAGLANDWQATLDWFRALLVEPACTWLYNWETRVPEGEQGWERLRQDFSAHFRPIDTASDFMHRYLELTQTGDIQEYIFEFEKLRVIMPAGFQATEEHLVTRFKEGLNPDIASRLAGNRYSTLGDIENAALDVGRALKNTRSSRPSTQLRDRKQLLPSRSPRQ